MRPLGTRPLVQEAVGAALLACAVVPAARAGDDPAPLRLNQLQARGTHNSYHRHPQLPPSSLVADWQYSHRPLADQLEHQGVRQLELDVHYNWARRELEVYHAWLGDDRSTCDLLSECLAEVRQWSDAHPAHQPLLVLLEPKDAELPELPEDGDPFTKPFDEEAYQLLDETVLDAFGERVITPDELTLPGETLRDSILDPAGGWPVIDDVRQHVLFLLDGDDHRDAYSFGQTTLAGRAVFVQADPGAPVAAFVGRGSDADNHASVAAGFIVRDLVDPSEFAAALAAGVQYLSTDYPDDLHLSDAPDAPARCNPVTAPPGCDDHAVEVHVPAGPDPGPPPDGPEAAAADKLERLVGGSLASTLALLPL